jgi:hypothetical protein
LSEVGPVVWPTYPETSVGVRSGEPTVIDLARLHEPATRTLLARAVLMVDAADGKESTTAGPRSTATPAGHPAAQGPSGSDRAAGEHSASSDDPKGLRAAMSRFTARSRVVVENAQKRSL